MEALIVKPTEYGIEEKKALELLGNLPQIKQERIVLEKQYKEIILLDIEDPQTSKKARELRLLIQKNRTQGIMVWHKNTKDYFLKGGQFVDAIKRLEVDINERMESQLEEIEKYAEIKEQKRLDELECKRKEVAQPYSEFIPFGINLRNISDEDFEKLLNGAKLQLEVKLEAERKEEEKRLENERLDKLVIERQLQIAPYAQFLNTDVSLREMSDEDYKKLFFELQQAKQDYDEEQEKIRLENERLKKEAEEKEAQRQSELKAEREKQAKLEAELRAKKDEEEKAERERLAEIERQKKEAEKLAKAPIKKQLNVWVDSFEIQVAPVFNQTTNEIQEKFSAFKKWAKTQIENI